MYINKMAIVAIGYNKVDSLKRLLNSLNNADYAGDNLPLIISIDNSGNDEVCEMANHFEWKHGEKIVRTFPERQGLRKHILSCGDFLDNYDALFVFEDDIVVSPQYYEFGKKCIDFYIDCEDIEGISLYSTKWNQNANFAFEPLATPYDTYFHQCAPSWGQIWFREKWQQFKKWYDDNLDFFEREQTIEIPSNLYTWGKNSWLKYYIAYCAIFHKYFVYPYYSYTSAFVENGTHFGTDLTRFHAEMMIFTKDFNFAPFDNAALKYNALYENEILCNYFDNSVKDNLCIDLYGKCNTEKNKFRYLLSTQILPYTKVRTYGLQLRPIELNIYLDIKGDGIYLYDCTSKQKNKVEKKLLEKQIVTKWDYFTRERFILGDEVIPICKNKFGNLIRTIMRKK